MRTLPLLIGLATAVALATAAIAHDYQVHGLTIDHPRTVATPPGATTAVGYVTIRNDNADDDRLLGATSSAAERVEVHRTEVKDGVATMRPIADGLVIPAGAALELSSGGTHLMLIGLTEPIIEHLPVPLTLEFEKAGTVDVEMAVLPLGAAAGHPGHGHAN
jgi:hypothetical protein